jgi:NAD dependent epimerase/dehydratase family enzyme
VRITLTGASGLIGSKLVAALKGRGDEVTVLSRNPETARERLGVDTHAWDPTAEPAPAAALAGREAVVHLAGEPVAQR